MFTTEAVLFTTTKTISYGPLEIVQGSLTADPETLGESGSREAVVQATSFARHTRINMFPIEFITVRKSLNTVMSTR